MSPLLVILLYKHLRGKFMGKIYGENLWENLRGKFMGKISGKNFQGNFAGKIYGENVHLWGKI